MRKPTRNSSTFISVVVNSFLLAAAFLLAASPGEAANDYPSNPIHFVVPFAAGGGVDSFSRIIGKKAGEILGQPIIVVNRVGGGGIVGTNVVAQSPPDGYTFLVTTSGHTILPSMSKLPWDPVADFAPVTMGVLWPIILAVNDRVPAKSLPELLALARDKPGSLNFGTGGIGTAPHLAMELLMSMTKTKFQHIAYRGNGPATLALISGETEVGIDTIASLLQQIRAGKLRPIAVAGAHRSPILPDVPTVGEAGVPGYSFGGWTGVFAPKGTPKQYIEKMNAAIREALQDPEIMDYFKTQGYEIVGNTPEQFSKIVQEDLEKVRTIVVDVDIGQAK